MAGNIIIKGGHVFDPLNKVNGDVMDIFIKDGRVVDRLDEKDAKNRILEARKRAEQLGISFKGIPEGGWKVVGIKGYRLHVSPAIGPATGLKGMVITPEWNIASENLEHKAELFARFMTNVAGQFTKAFLSEVSEYVDDRWLLSVFIHLLLNSLSMWYGEEARLFPYI